MRPSVCLRAIATIPDTDIGLVMFLLASGSTLMSFAAAKVARETALTVGSCAYAFLPTPYIFL